MSALPNIISASRGAAAVAMLFLPVFSPGFWVLYCWGGLSDIIDGAMARKMKSESGLGSRIDSVVDLVFVICSAVLILPSLDLPVWIWLWTAAIGVVKLAGIIFGSCRQRRLAIPHSTTNKLTGTLLFCLPFAIIPFGSLVPAAIVCSVATICLFEDYEIIRI